MAHEEQSLTIKIGPRSQKISIAIAALVVVLALVDFVALRGSSVGAVRVDLDGSEPAAFELTEVGKPHMVRIETTRLVKGKREGRNVDYRIVGPNGTVIIDESEFVDRKTRYVRFVPYVAGVYTITVSDDSRYLRGGSRNGDATVTVHANDRRIMPSLLPF